MKNTAHKVFPSKNQLLTIRKILQDLKYDEPLTVIPGRCPILSLTVQNLPCDLSVNNRYFYLIFFVSFYFMGALIVLAGKQSFQK